MTLLSSRGAQCNDICDYYIWPNQMTEAVEHEIRLRTYCTPKQTRRFACIFSISMNQAHGILRWVRWITRGITSMFCWPKESPLLALVHDLWQDLKTKTPGDRGLGCRAG
jgi:hypothetical protein